MTSSFPSFASFPEPEEDTPKRSQDKKEHKRREKERDKGRESKNGRKRPRSRSRSSSREQGSKRDKDRERPDKKRRRGKDKERSWRPEDDQHDKEHQDRLLAEGREPESKPGTHLWFSDFKGDPLNITFGKLYKGKVPIFRRAEREFCANLPRIIIIFFSPVREACPRPPSFLRSPRLVAHRWSEYWSTRPS